MKVNGREVGFLKTVQAACEIGEICPDKDVSKIGVLFQSSVSTTEYMTVSAYFIECMSRGYEMAKKFSMSLEGKDYDPKPVTIEEAMTLDENTFSQLFVEATQAFLNDKRTVEVEEPKKKANKKAVTSD